MVKTRESIYQILAEHTGKTLEQITKDCDRDYYMSPKEAKDYKLIDHIFINRAKPEADKK
jgi:ATP-dependent Clp protease protease subunit